MPIYEYRCEDCGERSDLFHKAGAGETLSCPQCGAQRLRRLFSSVAVHGDQQARLRDLSWIDRSARERLQKKLKGDTLLG